MPQSALRVPGSSLASVGTSVVACGEPWLTFEPVARTLVDTFYTTLDDPRHSVLVPHLESIEPELRGIAYEGAGHAFRNETRENFAPGPAAESWKRALEFQSVARMEPSANSYRPSMRPMGGEIGSGLPSFN